MTGGKTHIHVHVYTEHTCTCKYITVHCSYMYMYMLGTILKPSARFKAVRTALKPSERNFAVSTPSGRPASQRAMHSTRTIRANCSTI